MKLPNQTKAVERKTYNANAVSAGANTSILGALLPLVASGIIGALT
ncbi:hypothetical protein [Kordia sp.]